MKTTLATTLLATLASQALSAGLLIGVRNTEFYAAADTQNARIVFHGPETFNKDQDQWSFQLPDPVTGDTVLIQHVLSEKYIECSLGEQECVLSDNGTSFTAYQADEDNAFFIVGAQVEGEGDWVLEAGDALHLAAPAEEVNAQWFSFAAAEPEADAQAESE